MIKRTIKYIASDGTEHDSPQEAATANLENELCRLVEQALPEISSQDMGKLTMNLAVHLPEALRDAVNAYFDDLEEHPDVDLPVGVDGQGRVVTGGMALCAQGIIAAGQLFSDAQAVAQGLRHTGHQAAGKRPAQGNPDDPTTWRADLPVDHPSYCRPFGTRED